MIECIFIPWKCIPTYKPLPPLFRFMQCVHFQLYAVTMPPVWLFYISFSISFCGNKASFDTIRKTNRAFHVVLCFRFLCVLSRLVTWGIMKPAASLQLPGIIYHGWFFMMWETCGGPVICYSMDRDLPCHSSCIWLVTKRGNIKSYSSFFLFKHFLYESIFDY